MFQFILNWSEVWALLIPLLVIVVYKPKGPYVSMLILYVIFAFVLNFLAVFIVEYSYLIPRSLKYRNNILYNLHTLIRVIFLGWYILNIGKHRYPLFLKSLLAAYLVFVVINFSFLESPFILSSLHFAASSLVLLFLCISFLLFSLQDENGTEWIKQPSFIVCTAIALYEAITFFIFLFIFPIAEKNPGFAKISMQIYQIIFVVFCILLSVALYKSRKKHPAYRKTLE